MNIPNILLVEDDFLDIINFQRALQKINLTHKLLIAKNGEEALAILGGHGDEKLETLPDLVLIDLNMPKMNGIELLQSIRSNESYRNLKVFIITTSSEQEDKDITQNLGISGYIVKPFNSKSHSSMDSFNLMIDLMNLK